MSAALQALTGKLTAIRAQLEAGQLIEAAATVQDAVQLCAQAQGAGGEVDRAALEAAQLLEQQCAEIAQRVVASLVKSQREAGTMEKAIRAYAGG